MHANQHIHHAGSWFDVHRQACLCALWAQMVEDNEGTLTFIDTHAGRGIYDLTSEAVQKASEFKTGIAGLDLGRLPKNFAPYVHAVREWKPDYPGAAGCIATLKQDQDLMVLHESDPDNFKALTAALGIVPGTVMEPIEAGPDTVLKALPDGAGAKTLIMINSRYENKDDYEQTVETVKAILTRAPKTQILIWFPVLVGSGYHKIILKGLGDFWDDGLRITIDPPFARPPAKGIVSSELILLNPPEGAERTLYSMTEILERVLRKSNDT